MRIQGKLLTIVGVLAVAAVAVVATALYAVRQYDNELDEADRIGRTALYAERLNRIVATVVMDSRGIYYAETTAEAKPFGASMRQSLQEMDAVLAAWKPIVTPDRRVHFDEITRLAGEFKAVRLETIRLGTEVSPAAANEQGNNEANTANRRVFQARIDASVKASQDEQTELIETMASFELLMRSLVIGVSVVGLLIGGGLAMWIGSRMLARPLREVSETLQRMAGGDLALAIPDHHSGDEIEEIWQATRQFRDGLVEAERLKELELAHAAERMARAEQMAAVVERVSGAVEAAARGDFNSRLSLQDVEADLQQLVSGINDINAVVDGATVEFAQVLGAVAQGDLTRVVTTEYAGRFGDLKNAINDTIQRLAATVDTIKQTAAEVAAAAGEIQTGAQDLSQRTEGQASSLEETAATTEELAASVKASADSSRHAVDLAIEARGVAETGGGIVQSAVDAMNRIEGASRKISEITSVIDGIAFQTNLLALNAAVEAARAGEQGRGFAVVASEVRTLAQRSGEAAKGISELIRSSTAEVEQGVSLVRSAGEALVRIVGATGKVSDTVNEIATASNEQANGIDEMSQAVAHMDEMTQQNAALAEESAAAAAMLADQIQRLNHLVATFKTQQAAASEERRPRGRRNAAQAGTWSDAA